MYYSYYKQLLNAPSLSYGLEQLQMDNLTESTSTINILQRYKTCFLSCHHYTALLRFNIYQEMVLAALYNTYNFRLSPIMFYTYSVFSLQGLYLSALYLLTWSLSGSWLAGVLTTITINRYNMVDDGFYNLIWVVL